MNTSSNIASSRVTAPGYSNTPMRPFYWSVRRELWENRSIYVAPLIVAVVVLLGSSSARLVCRNAAALSCCLTRQKPELQSKHRTTSRR